MDRHINEEELTLLAWLHENVQGWGSKFALMPRTVELGLSWDEKQLAKSASYLAEHGLVGVVTTDTRNASVWSSTLDEIWLTGDGEDYMRALEQSPEIGKTITVMAVTQSWSLIKGVASAVLTDYVSRKLGLK